MKQNRCILVHCLKGRTKYCSETRLVSIVRELPKESAVAFVSSMYDQQTLMDELRPCKAKVCWFRDFIQSAINDWYESMPECKRILVVDDLKSHSVVPTEFLYSLDLVFQTIDRMED